jgi:hypothetical protein
VAEAHHRDPREVTTAPAEVFGKGVARSGSPEPVDDRHAQFVSSLSPEERTLLILRDELYDGSWVEMRADLAGRRDGKPFIFQLASRIDEDLDRIARLARYEDEHQLDLGEYLDDEE